jgi:adenosylcobinamide-phosphate synthase
VFVFEAALILGLAFALDLLVGDPAYRLHPVRCIGYTARGLESLLWRLHFNGLLGGCLLVILTLMVALGVSLGVSTVVRHYNDWGMWIWHIYLTTSCVALRDLMDHARPVSEALRRGDLMRARAAVQRIVGRDAASLDETGVARAAVETVAENFVDGFLAPLFWYVVGAVALRDIDSATGALAALVTYRVANTLDAMVGYRNKRYVLFGRAAARLDDVLNFIPARLSILILSLSATLCRKDGLGALKVAWRDRTKHISPSAGHPESCLAGALHICLGGLVAYAYGTVDKSWLGHGVRKVTAAHIDCGCRIVFVAGCIACTLSLLVLANDVLFQVVEAVVR